mmetsp:Transcript_13708/g.30179  ORF Transcript_13708/g.30179 Transcript_13708/m.30179 type:complete len:218 (-) Transcript_13708:469-1122(-)
MFAMFAMCAMCAHVRPCSPMFAGTFQLESRRGALAAGDHDLAVASGHHVPVVMLLLRHLSLALVPHQPVFLRGLQEACRHRLRRDNAGILVVVVCWYTRLLRGWNDAQTILVDNCTFEGAGSQDAGSDPRLRAGVDAHIHIPDVVLSHEELHGLVQDFQVVLAQQGHGKFHMRIVHVQAAETSSNPDQVLEEMPDPYRILLWRHPAVYEVGEGHCSD